MGRKKKTHKEFTKEVYELVGDEYEVLGVYKGTNIKIEIKHNKCGHTYSVKPNNFLSGRRCPKCEKLIQAKRQTKTHGQFVQEVYKLVGNEYEILGIYKGREIKLEMKHNKCGHIYSVTPHGFLNGNRCPNCGRLKNILSKRKTHKDFIKEIYNLVGDEYEILGTYINNSTYIEIKHNCGHKYTVRPCNFLAGNRCPKCARLNRFKTHEQFVKEIYDLVFDEYELVGDYINSDTKIEIKHNCGHKYHVRPDVFLGGCRCPKCCRKTSKGIKKIRKILSSLGIGFNPEKRFDDCRSLKGGMLPFDIQPLINKLLLIEYDGEHHTKPVPYGGISWEEAEKNFITTQAHDAIKDAYCEKEGIPLLRIDYTEFDDIEKLLIEFLVKHGVIDKNGNLILDPAA